MAQITITIPDAAVPMLTDVFGTQAAYKQFLRQQTRRKLREHRLQTEAATAGEAAAAGFDADWPEET